MLFEVILQFLKQKVIEIFKGISFIISVLVGVVGSIMLLIMGTGWITYTLFHSYHFTNFLHVKGGYWDNVSSFGCFSFFILCLIFFIIALSSLFVDWIKDNWIKAKEVVEANWIKAKEIVEAKRKLK